MARSIKHEQRLLNADELTLVEKSHHPALGLLPDHDLKELRKLVRERRDRAQDIAARQRRELRGKAGPKGARPATGDSGTREKRDLLAAALQRLNKEAARSQSRPPGIDRQRQARARGSPGERKRLHAALAGTHGQ